MVSIREMAVANDIAEMAALGWFAEEFIVYGCCYIENGTIYYKVSSQNTELYRFKDDCMKRGIYVSPVVELLNRVMVPSGMQEEYLLKTKLKLAKQMRQKYDADLLRTFIALAGQDDNNSAENLMLEMQRKMTGCFEREVVQLVESIIEYAFQQKKLNRQTYAELCQWLDYVYGQMEDDVVIRKNFQRTFYGFAYRTATGVLRYYTNASAGETRKRKEELLCKGTRCTPVLQKTYYFDNQPNLLQVKETFVAQLKQWMDEEYWGYLHDIDRLPLRAPMETYHALIQQAKERNSGFMTELLQYYYCLWNLPTK